MTSAVLLLLALAALPEYHAVMRWSFAVGFLLVVLGVVGLHRGSILGAIPMIIGMLFIALGGL